MQNDVVYWDEYYSRAPKEISEASDFAKFALEYMKSEKTIIDLGCGNGRDSLYFFSYGLKVTAIDSSKSAIANIESKHLPIFALCDDFVKTKVLDCIEYDYCYARWVIHAINQTHQDEFIPKIYNMLKKGGLFFAEVRTVRDEKYGKGESLGKHEFLFDNHYRRFIEPDKLINQLQNTGFEVLYGEESDAFSVMADDTPTLLRLVVQKQSKHFREFD